MNEITENASTAHKSVTEDGWTQAIQKFEKTHKRFNLSIGSAFQSSKRRILALNRTNENVCSSNDVSECFLERYMSDDVLGYLFDKFIKTSQWSCIARVCKRWNNIASKVFHPSRENYAAIYLCIENGDHVNLRKFLEYYDHLDDANEDDNLQDSTTYDNIDRSMNDEIYVDSKGVLYVEYISESTPPPPSYDALLEESRTFDQSESRKKKNREMESSDIQKSSHHKMKPRRMRADHNRNSPIIKACRTPYDKVVKVLLDRPEVDPNARGGMPLRNAFALGYEATVSVLLNDPRTNPDDINTEDFKVLPRTAGMVRVLLDSGRIGLANIRRMFQVPYLFQLAIADQDLTLFNLLLPNVIFINRIRRNLTIDNLSDIARYWPADKARIAFLDNPYIRITEAEWPLLVYHSLIWLNWDTAIVAITRPDPITGIPTRKPSDGRLTIHIPRRAFEGAIDQSREDILLLLLSYVYDSGLTIKADDLRTVCKIGFKTTKIIKLMLDRFGSYRVKDEYIDYMELVRISLENGHKHIAKELYRHPYVRKKFLHLQDRVFSIIRTTLKNSTTAVVTSYRDGKKRVKNKN